MLCENCKKKEASLFFKNILDGQVKELKICDDCAAQRGLNVKPSEFLAEFLFKGKPAAKGHEKMDELVCPECGMRSADMRKLSRMGCPECYKVFEQDLAEMISGMQKGDVHIGKRPANRAANDGRDGLEKDLAKAVAEQNFEEAARIRDIIRSAEGPEADQNTE